MHRSLRPIPSLLLLSVVVAAIGLGGFRSPRVDAQDATPTADAAASPAADCPATTPEENTALAVRYVGAWDRGDVAGVVALLAPDYVHHWGIGRDTEGSVAMGEAVAAFFGAFPDVTMVADQTIAEGDLVVVRWTMTGTQTGEINGIGPSDALATWTGMNIFRVACGRLAEGWSEADHFGRLTSLGVISPEELATDATPAA